MTREEEIRILDPVTTGEELSEIEYYGGFRGRTDDAFVTNWMPLPEPPREDA